MYTFYSQFSTRTDRKSVAKRAGCSKNKTHYFFALRISFIQWGINENKKRSPENLKRIGQAGDFIFSNKKKNIRNGIHCRPITCKGFFDNHVRWVFARTVLLALTKCATSRPIQNVQKLSWILAALHSGLVSCDVLAPWVAQFKYVQALCNAQKRSERRRPFLFKHRN